MQEADSTAPAVQRGEIDVLEVITMLGEEKKVLLGFPIVAGLLALVYGVVQVPIFTAKTTILLPQREEQSIAAAAFARSGALAGVTESAAKVRAPEELYASLLRTESFENGLIDKLELKRRYREETLLGARKALEARVQVTPDRRTGLLIVEADDEDPVFAAKMANAVVDELRLLLDRLAVTEAQQRRLFFEQQIARIQEEIAAAESRSQQAREQGGRRAPSALAQGSAEEKMWLRGQIASHEVRLQALRTFASMQNPELIQLTAELGTMRSRLSLLEQGNGVARPTRLQGEQAPLDYRDVRLRETLLAMYTRQLEVARSDEAHEGALVQQVSVATPPEKKSKPNPGRMTLIAGAAGAVFGVLLAFLRAARRRAAGDPAISARLARARNAWFKETRAADPPEPR